MPERDYSATLLSKKLGAKPGANVVVLFTTSADDLAKRFPALKRTLGASEGLWVAWPKKASRLETDLDFETVQEHRARGRARRQQERLDRRRLAGAPLRVPAQRPLA